MKKLFHSFEHLFISWKYLKKKVSLQIKKTPNIIRNFKKKTKQNQTSEINRKRRKKKRRKEGNLR